MCTFSTGSSHWYERAGRDGGSVLRGPAQAKEADGTPQPPAPAGLGGRHHWDTVESVHVSKMEHK